LRASGNAAAAEAPLRNALAERNGFYISKAAALAEHFGLRALTPDLAAAFTRFLIDEAPAKSDPQCWAKTALVSALHSLDYRRADLYLRGLRFTQPEPVFGGRADSAGALRGKCALALADSDDLPPHRILNALTDVLVDPDRAARLDAVRAVARLAQPESAVLIRFKALTGDEHPDVMRECLLSLMTLAPADSTEFVARYLQNPEANELLCADAAEALASARHPGALAALLAFVMSPRLPVDIRRTTLLTLAASPLPEAGEHLASIIVNESEEEAVAEAALTALGASRFREEHRRRIVEHLEARKSPRLAAAFAKAFVHPQV